MARNSQLDELARLVDTLIDCADDRTRDRVLIEAILALGWAQAAALYRRTAEPSAPASGWFEALARGPVDLLPSTGQVEAVAAGELPAELPLGRHVIISGREAGATALALGGAGDDEERLDLLEAVFEVLVAVGTSSEQPAPSILNLIDAPLPAAEEDDSASDGQHELRNLLTSINSVQSLLAGDLGELDDQDVERYEGIFDVECERAADLLGEALSGTQGMPSEGLCNPSAELAAWARRETRRPANQAIEIESLCAMALEDRVIDMSAANFRHGLWLLVENALSALHSQKEGCQRLQVLWTPHADGAALLVIEDSSGCAPDEQLASLERELTRLGWRTAPLERTAHGLRAQALFDLR